MTQPQGKLRSVVYATDFFSLIHEKSRQLMKGTREWIFMDIRQWLKLENGSKVFLICGDGGTGKSCISAALICRLSHLGANALAWYTLSISFF